MNRNTILLLTAALLWSSGGVLIKTIVWNPLGIAGFRSALAFIVISIWRPRLVRQFSWQILPGSIAFAATVILFVVATKLTTAANAIFLQYTAPIYIGLFAPLILKEKTTKADWALIFLALGGVMLFFADRLTICGVAGNLIALGSGLCFAFLTIFMRQQRNSSPATIVLFGNLMTAVIMLPWTIPVYRWRYNLPWLMILGLFQIALPYLLYSEAIRHVRALDAAIISLIEPILNPVWVLLSIGEAPSSWALLGGAIVLCSSLARSILAERKAREVRHRST